MRQSRLLAPQSSPTAFYHCISRVVDRRFALGDTEKMEFVRLMRLYATFSGVKIVTFCLMSNHFHILLEVPRRPEGFALSDEELFARLMPINSSLEISTLRQQLAMLRKNNANKEIEAAKETIYSRMFDLPSFMKVLKGRFTQWYNRANKRKGTLWEERYKSVLVEGAGTALTTMAAYIDLNPVRAGLVADPKNYRWSGYGAANGGNKTAVSGLQIICDANECQLQTDQSQSVDTVANYRKMIYQRGLEGAENEEGVIVKRGFTEAEIAEVIAKKGKLSRLEMLHCRVRYFSDGLVIGSKDFLKSIFSNEQAVGLRFGKKRTISSHPLRGVDGGGIRSLRDLKVRALG